MKIRKRVCSALLALVLALSAAVMPASAAEGFSDVSDTATARSAEVLRLLGVMEGDGTGRFDPSGKLTRAQFCKMVVVLMGKGDEAVRYQTVTIFPDVRASHWAAGYINLAVRQTEPKLLAGQPDGTFAPDRAISYGEAVTILMRLLGYTDAQSGGIWPDGYINLAKSTGVSAGVTLAGSASITRAQAAQLFVNLLSTGKDGKGYTPKDYTRSGEVTLISMSGSTVRVSENGASKKYDLAGACSSTVFNGLKGNLLLDSDGKVVSFVPKKSSASSTVFASNAAVIISADQSTSGISALTDGRTDYAVYRNGVRASVSALKKNDVVTYDAASNTVFACDTRVTVYYESCEPSPAAPVSISALGGTVFNVLPTAQQSLSKFKPGKTVTLLLASDGSVAGAVSGDSSARGNALGIVAADGAVELLVGGTTIELTMKGVTSKAAELTGQLVSVSASAKGKVDLYAKTGGVSGDLNVREGKLGAKKLADGVILYDDGVLTVLSELEEATVPASRISYARTNAAGEIDLLVLSSTAGELYGRAVVYTEKEWESDLGGGSHEVEVTYLVVETPAGQSEKLRCSYSVSTGDFVAVKITDGRIRSLSKLDKLSGVSASAWIGTSAVNYGGRTYTVSGDVACRNRDSGSWLDGIEAALAYGGTMDLYVRDGMVRVVEVRA